MPSVGLCIRLSSVLVICFLLLQLYLYSFDVEKGDVVLSVAATKVFTTYKKISDAFNTNAETDSTGQYKIISVSQKMVKKPLFDVTYVSQCSWNRFNFIESLLEEWQGPVSVAVFSEMRFIDEVLWRMSLTVYCHRLKEIYLSLVVPTQDVHPTNHDYGIEMAKRLNESELCKPPYSIDYKNIKNYNWSTPYPVNLLRNVAKSRCNTEYVLVTDIDMMPSADLRRNFLRYIWSKKTHPKKMVFVVPSFEMNFGIKMPRTKYEIISEMQKGNMRPFYFLPCRKCQSLTNYSRWFSYPNQPGTRVLYRVGWRHPWEPFFVSYRDAPNYDERFKQYGFNRVSQACQLHIEGYSFLILDNAFLIHRGFKTLTDFHKTKNLEMNENRKLYEQFKHEMRKKYPNSNRKCDG